MLLYQNMIIRESGKMSDALDHLITHEHQIPDKLAVTELKGTCPMQSCQHVFPILELTLWHKRVNSGQQPELGSDSWELKLPVQAFNGQRKRLLKGKEQV